VTIDDIDARASTLLGYAGAYSVTLSTTLPELALELHSVYLGQAQTPTSAELVAALLGLYKRELRALRACRHPHLAL
jgi:hypothetical protein